MDWQAYEKEILDKLELEYPDALITHNHKVVGRHSQTLRQCDFIIDEIVSGNKLRTFVEAKFHKRPIDVKGIEEFLGMLDDLNAQNGLLVSLSGFSKPAKVRALAAASTKLELDILNVDELLAMQGLVGIPYVGGFGAVVRAPFGWVIDASGQHPWTAMFYPRGLNCETAIETFQFMYIDFWNKERDPLNVDDLIDQQNAALKKHYPDPNIDVRGGPNRMDASTRIRTAEILSTRYEISGFVEFDRYIAFCVLHCQSLDKRINVGKVYNFLRTLLPVQIALPDK